MNTIWQDEVTELGVLQHASLWQPIGGGGEDIKIGEAHMDDSFILK